MYRQQTLEPPVDDYSAAAADAAACAFTTEASPAKDVR